MKKTPRDPGPGGPRGFETVKAAEALVRGVQALRDALRLLQTAWKAGRANLPATLVLGLLPAFVYAFGGALLETMLPENPTDREALQWAAGIVAFTAAWLAAAVFSTGVLARAATGVLLQREVPPETALETAVDRFPRLAWGALLYVVAVAGGLLLLVVPGLVLAALLLVWPQGILFEYRKPIEALRRSWEVVRSAVVPTTLAVAALLVPALLLALAGWTLAARTGPWAAAPFYALAAAVPALALPLLSSAVFASRHHAVDAEEERARRAANEREAAPDGRFRYACPSCGREYLLPRMPAAGTPCPACRSQASGSR